VTYSSSTSFRLENIVYRSQATSTVTNEGPLQLELLNSAYTLLAPWTPGADVSVKLEDKPSYFGTAATFKIPQGRIFTITGGDMPGKVYGLPGADIHLDGVLNGDLGLYGAFNSSRIPDWTGYYPDRPLPTYLNLAQSPGDGTINGDLTLGRLATLVCELAGTQQGVTYDHLDVNGTLTINGGLLDLRFLDGFETTTQPTDVFVLVEADAPIAGAFANVASGQRLNTSDGLRSFEVHYGAGSAHGENRVVATNAGPFVDTAVPPAIGTQPSTRNATAGSNPTFTVAATGAGPFTYQWYFNGIAISGATNATLTIPFAQAFQAGTYSVIVSNAHGAVVSSPAVLNISKPPPNNARLLNLSTRALAQTGDNVLIPGFVISGTGTKKLLIRAVGPRLAQMGVPADDVLPDPRMILKRWNGNSYDDLLANDNWIDNANAVDIALTAEDVFAFPLESDLEAALLVDLAPGQYTVVADGVNNLTGTAMVEVYDADASNPSARLLNISNRGFCGVGDQVMIPGFWVSHEGAKTFLIRVVGPSLGKLGVTSGTMDDPKLEIYPSGAKTPILSNDDWGDNPDAAYTAAIAQQVFAFSLAEGGTDAALVVTLPPGGYTVVGSSADGTSTGVILVEVYLVP
ncbi:MAG TPA: immunoglobulin domain-containing protein, partial [Rhodanobacteraceae bacterium]